MFSLWDLHWLLLFSQKIKFFIDVLKSYSCNWVDWDWGWNLKLILSMDWLRTLARTNVRHEIAVRVLRKWDSGMPTAPGNREEIWGVKQHGVQLVGKNFWVDAENDVPVSHRCRQTAKQAKVSLCGMMVKIHATEDHTAGECSYIRNRHARR